MKSVLVVHPRFDVIGGAELVSLHVLNWLLSRNDVKVTLLTLTPVNFDYVQSETGLSLASSRLKVLLAYCPRFIREAQGKFALLRLAFLHRAARRKSGYFDICISTYNEIDFGKLGFQYIHCPIFADKDILRTYEMVGKISILDNVHFLNALYRKIVFLISGDKIEGFKKNISVVNSEFIKRLVRDVYGIESTVLYPAFMPKGDLRESQNWEDRSFQFVAVGRISPDKDYIKLLDLFKALLTKFVDARFVIVGRVSDQEYEAVVRDKARRLGLPLEFVTDANREQLIKILGSSKFFIHAKAYEHFGIAIVEAIVLGCIPLIHDSGGQTEIVIPDILRYRSAQVLVRNVQELCSKPEIRQLAFHEIQDIILKLRSRSFAETVEVFFRPMLQ